MSEQVARLTSRKVVPTLIGGLSIAVLTLVITNSSGSALERRSSIQMTVRVEDPCDVEVSNTGNWISSGCTTAAIEQSDEITLGVIRTLLTRSVSKPGDQMKLQYVEVAY